MRAMGDCYVEGSGAAGADWLKVGYYRPLNIVTREPANFCITGACRDQFPFRVVDAHPWPR